MFEEVLFEGVLMVPPEVDNLALEGAGGAGEGAEGGDELTGELYNSNHTLISQTKDFGW